LVCPDHGLAPDLKAHVGIGEGLGVFLELILGAEVGVLANFGPQPHGIDECLKH
jgi:hypothetical protein